MNKYLGLFTLLLAPEGLSSSSGAGVESPPGAAPKAPPASDNFYGSGNEPVDTGPDKGEKPDFSGAKDDGKPDFVKIGGEEKPDAEVQPELNEDGSPKVAPTVEPKPQLMKLDPETIAALRQQVAPATPTKEAPKLTPQQLKEMLNPVEVTDEVIANMGHEDPAVRRETLQNFANATVKNAVSIARIMIQQARKEVEAAINPISETMEQQRSEQVRNSFYTEHPHLTKFDKLVKQAALEVGQDPSMSNADRKATFKAIADRVSATLKEFGVEVSPANLGAGGGANGGGTKVPQPNKLSPSGRSGGDTNGQRGRANDADADIYKR